MRVWNKHHGDAPAGAVYVGRPSKWGNPYEIGHDGTRDEVIAKYRAWIQQRPELLVELKGKHLVCWCAPKACHADVLLTLANEERAVGDRIKVEGFVEKIFVKDGTNARGAWQAFSIKVQKASGEVDPRFYQFGFERPKFKEGDYVAFEAEIKDDKAAKFIEGTGHKPKNPPAKPAAPAQNGGGKGGYQGKGGGGGFKPRPPVESKLFGQIGQNSTEDDVRRISYASARTAALEAVSILLANDALPLSAAKTKAGQASRFEEVVAAIDKLTVEYFFDSASGRKLTTVADAGSKESRVAEVPTAEPGKGAAPAQSAEEAGDEPPTDDQSDDQGPPEDDDKF